MVVYMCKDNMTLFLFVIQGHRPKYKHMLHQHYEWCHFYRYIYNFSNPQVGKGVCTYR